MDRADSVDPEEVAALLDGRLSAEERAALMERLARSPEGFEMLAEAARLLEDDGPGDEPDEVRVVTDSDPVEADPAAVPVPPPSPVAAPGAPGMPPSMARPSRRRRLWIPALAVLALALLVPFALRRGGSGTGLRLRGSDLVANTGDGSLAGKLGTGWEDPWPGTRGGGGTAADAQREFRIGVRLVDVEIALDARDTPAVRSAQEDLAGLLAADGAPTWLAAEYADIGARAGDPTAKLRRQRARAAGDVRDHYRDSPEFEAGLWVEQVRLAAKARELDFFDTRFARDGDAVMARVREGDTSASLAPALEGVQALVRDGVTTGELEALQTALDDVIRQGAG